MEFLISILIIFITIIYSISVYKFITICVNKFIDPTFWPIVICFTPIVNTIFCIKYRDKSKKSESYGEFIKKLRNN